MKLDKIISELGMAGSIARRACMEETFTTFENFFTKDKDGKLHPKMLSLVIDGKTIEVPEFTLINHAAMDLTEFETEFETDIMLGPKKDKNIDDEKDGILSSTLRLKRDKKATTLKVRAKFTLGNPFEAAEKINDLQLEDLDIKILNNK
ncbi:MAG: hypothetical protein K0U39_02350 [Alphaproteobacteria bacterium]|nr:hypothetical protein [Alphaproteobacteria bacterium]